MENISKNQVSSIKNNQDLFGFDNQGKNYDDVRPVYPQVLIDKILQQNQNKQNYLDIATGTGQILFRVAPFYQGNQIIGNDISSKQLNVAKDKSINYNKEHENNKIQLVLSGYQDIQVELQKIQLNEKFDTITIGQAIHWLDRREFLSCCQQLLKPDGKLHILAYFAKGFKYNFQDQKLNEKGLERYDRVYSLLGPNFDFDRSELENKYVEKDKYPFEEYFKNVEFEDHQIVKNGKLGDFIRYIKTFSSYNTYIQRYPDLQDPVEEMIEGIKEDMSSGEQYKKYVDNIEDIDIVYRNDFFMYTLYGSKQ